VAVLARIVPAHTVVGVSAATALGQVQVMVDRVVGVGQPQGSLAATSDDTLHVEIYDVGNANTAPVALHLELYGDILGAAKVSGQAHPPFGGAAHLTRHDLAQGRPLLRVGPLVNVEGGGPVAVGHGARSVAGQHHIEVAQGSPVEIPFDDMKSKGHIAVTFSGSHTRALHNTGAKDIAVSILEVLALQPPSVGSHELPPAKNLSDNFPQSTRRPLRCYKGAFPTPDRSKPFR